MAIIVFCAWCQKILGEVGDKNQYGVSDGLCDECKEKLTPKIFDQEPVRKVDFEELDRQVAERLKLLKNKKGQSK